MLKDYHETISKESPLIRLFSPSGAPDAYWAETGYVSAGGVKTPNLDTVWTADAKTLTPEHPVTLTWDNGAGLVFKRVIAVDDKYMFTITDSVANRRRRGGDACRPYALVLRHGKPNVAGYSVLHEGFVGVIGDGGVQEVTYAAIDKDTGKTLTYKGDGGWLGFTDKYWGSAIIPEQTAPIEARFSASGTGQPEDYQADFVGAEQTVAPGASVETTTRVFAGAKEVSTIDNYGTKLGIKKFDLMIDWGWFYFITKPLFLADRRDLQVRRQFRRRDPDRHRAGQARLLPARQPLLPFDGEDEEDPAADRRAEGPLSRRQGQAAAGADGALQARGGQSGRRLPADGDPDPGVLRALQGDLHHHRDAARAVLRLDQGSFRARSDQRVHAVRPHPVGPDRPARCSAISSRSASGRSSWACRCSSR